jgi:hypothetical protein
VIDSPIAKGAIKATKSGIIETNTTALATVVYSRDVIQVAKWMAKNAPERIVRRICFLVSDRSVGRCFANVKGQRRRAAMLNRKAAMTKEGASACA